MKIRLGFVSNSSSASYYVTLRETPQDALLTITAQCSWPYFQEGIVLSKLDEWIKSYENRLEYIDKTRETFLIGSKESIELTLKVLQDKRKRIKYIFEQRRKDWTILPQELLDYILELNYITVEYKDDRVLLSATTAMHNNYIEGMPDLLKDIVLYYSFEEPERITLKVEHNG